MSIFCRNSYPYPEYRIVVGVHNLTIDGTKYAYGNVFRHPYFGNPEQSNDIALIKVASPIAFNDRVKPIEYSAHGVDGNETLFLSMILMTVYDFQKLIPHSIFFISWMGPSLSWRIRSNRIAEDQFKITHSS